MNFIVFAAVEPSFLECGSPTDDLKLHIFQGLDPGPSRFSEQKLFPPHLVFPGTKVKMSFISRWNMIILFTMLQSWELMNVAFDTKEINAFWQIPTNLPIAICPRLPRFLFRQTVRTFTLEHLISYTVGLGFLFVFFILLTPRFRGMFRGIFRSVPRCPLIPHNGKSSRKGTLLSRESL